MFFIAFQVLYSSPNIPTSTIARQLPYILVLGSFHCGSEAYLLNNAGAGSPCLSSGNLSIADQQSRANRRDGPGEQVIPALEILRGFCGSGTVDSDMLHSDIGAGEVTAATQRNVQRTCIGFVSDVLSRNREFENDMKNGETPPV